MNDYEPIPDCSDYEDAMQADWANQGQLLEQEQDRQAALVACRNLAVSDSRKSIRTAAVIMVAQLETANYEANYVKH